jgi:hypothetical protein
MAATNAVEEQAGKPPRQVYIGIVRVSEESRANTVLAGFSRAGRRVDTTNDIVN